MRLLEIRGNPGDAEPRHAGLMHKTDRKPAIDVRALQHPPLSKESPSDTGAFPIKNRPAEKPLRRRPIDLEQLQQRIEVLERRIHERNRNQADTSPPAKDLEQLKQRMKLLERRIEGELWSARQREHTMLEMLARPPIHAMVKHHCVRFLSTAPAATLRCLLATGKTWWQDAQPMWWPRFAAAWHEALARARQ